jgi:hypothetical protein
MPEISRFYGIVITMYFRDHNPPHFHARYGDVVGRFSIDPAKHMDGDLPRRVVALVLEWANKHSSELLENWKAVLEEQPFRKIDPLD